MNDEETGEPEPEEDWLRTGAYATPPAPPVRRMADYQTRAGFSTCEACE